MNRIVVGVNASPGAARALRWAYGTASRERAVLEVVTAYQPIRMLSPLEGVVTRDGSARDAASWVQQEVLREEFGPRVSDLHVECLVISGAPADVLVERSARASLLVVGRRSSRVRRFLTGSTSKQCANRAACPVVIVRGPARGDTSQMERLGRPPARVRPQGHSPRSSAA